MNNVAKTLLTFGAVTHVHAAMEAAPRPQPDTPAWLQGRLSQAESDLLLERVGNAALRTRCVALAKETDEAKRESAQQVNRNHDLNRGNAQLTRTNA